MEVKWKSGAKEEDLGIYALLLRGFNMAWEHLNGVRNDIDSNSVFSSWEAVHCNLRVASLKTFSYIRLIRFLRISAIFFSKIGWWISSDWSGSLESDQLILREPSWLICSDWSVTSSGRFAWEIACSNWLRVSSSKDVSPTWKEQLWPNSVQGNRDQNIEF